MEFNGDIQFLLPYWNTIAVFRLSGFLVLLCRIHMSSINTELKLHESTFTSYLYESVKSQSH